MSQGAPTRGARRRHGRGRLRRLLRLPLREKITTLHALAVLAVLEVLIRRVRLPRLAALAGVSLEASPGRRDPSPPGVQDPREVAMAVRSTRRVLRSWPFGGGPCLRESLVLGRLLRHASPLLRIGIANGSGGLHAHAWLEVDGQVLGVSEGFAPFPQAGGSPP